MVPHGGSAPLRLPEAAPRPSGPPSRSRSPGSSAPRNLSPDQAWSRAEGGSRPSPVGLDELQTAIAAATSRNDLGRELVRFTASRFRRTAAFAVRQDQILGWVGQGPGIDPKRLGQIAISIGSPSIFTPVTGSTSVYIGPLPAGPESRTYYTLFGSPIPPGILLVPITVRDRLAAILYADNQADPLGPIELPVWKRVAHLAAMSLEIMILRNRILRS